MMRALLIKSWPCILRVADSEPSGRNVHHQAAVTNLFGHYSKLTGSPHLTKISMISTAVEPRLWNPCRVPSWRK